MSSHYERPTADLLDVFADSNADVQARDRIRKRLDEARKVDFESATIAIASWENRFAVAGGVRAVTQEYAKYLTEQKRAVLVVTPLHTGLGTAPGALRLASVLWLDFDQTRRRVEVFEADWDGVKWIFVHCDGFFGADGGRDRSNPYVYEDDDRAESGANKSPRLVRDCLFYAAVVPKVLSALHIVDNVVLHLQDWETVGVGLSAKSAILRKEIKNAISILALHNPYDKYLGSDDWAKLTDRPEPANTPPTFLGRMLSFIDAPPATVSREFAIDLVADPLQTTHLAEHLQVQFMRFGITGVDNGPFESVKPPFSSDAISDAQNGLPDRILLQKQTLRHAMNSTMEKYQPSGRWGDVDFKNLENDVPVFMCVGRLDPGQKGFDVVARGIESLLNGGLNARFVLTPIIGNAPQQFVDDLQSLATNRTFAGSVVVYPFRMREGYAELQGGSTFSIWPSMYEPFGGVSEFLLRGTPVIARSTGGLRQQIVSFDQTTGEGNGILYKTNTTPTQGEWRAMQNEVIPANRMNHPVYKDQVDQFVDAIKQAVTIFGNPRAYGRLLSNVPGSVAGYSWKRAADEYASLYNVARQ